MLQDQASFWSQSSSDVNMMALRCIARGIVAVCEGRLQPAAFDGRVR